jgi:parvulin-like peptidyl-prolyl isomerase
LDKRTLITAAASLALGALAGAGITSTARDDSLLGGPASGPVLARYAGRTLTLGEAEAALRAPGNQLSGGVLSSPEGRRSVVEGLVRVELLARLAEEKGYHRDPAFQRRVKQELAATYLLKEFEEPERKRAPTDAELAKYFEENQANLQRPERLRLAIIAFRAEDDATRRAKRPAAQQALAEVRRRAGDYYAFGEIAAAKSEEPKSASTSGELPPMSREELEAGFGPTLAAKAFAMARKPGTLLDGVVEGERGLFVVKLLSVEPPYEPKLDELRDSLRTQLTTERRTTGLEAFLGAIWKQADVKIDEEALKQLKAPPPGGAAAK